MESASEGVERRWQEFRETFRRMNDAFASKFAEAAFLGAGGGGASAGRRSASSFKRPTRKQVSMAAGELLRDFGALPAVQRAAFRVTRPAGGKALFPPVPLPGPGDWLANHEERGQSWKSYSRRSFRPSPHGHVKVLEVVPVGDFDPDDSPPLETLVRFMTIFFGFECRATRAVALEDVAASGLVDGSQLLCGDAMDYLKRRKVPRDVFAQIAVTMTDLTPGKGWNFVYGQASLMNGVGVFSFARYSANFWRGESAQRPLTLLEHAHLLQKSCKTMAHEVTHILGLRHCIYFSCIMNGNNGDEHAPLQLCPICLRKVHDACKDGNGGRGMDVVERYRSLMMFYDRHGWEESLAFATARHAALSAVGEQTETRHAESTVKRAQAQQHYPKRRRQGTRVRLKHSDGHLESSPKPSPKRQAQTSRASVSA